MYKRIHLIFIALASALAAGTIQAAPQSNDATPPVQTTSTRTTTTIDMSNPQADVVAVTREGDGAGDQLTIRSVQDSAAPGGPRPSFDSLDTNHDGVISESEAEAYVPLANDYLHLYRKGSRGISRSEYEHWQ